MRQATDTGDVGSASGHPRTGRAALLAGAFLAVASALPAEEQANYTDKIPETKIEFEMVFIKGGTFQMGSNDGAADEKPVKEVTVEPFWMGKYEVTWDEYEEFWMSEPDVEKAKDPASSDAVTRPSAAYEPPDKGWGRTKMPCMHTSFHAAMHYCEWLTRITGKKYRLPTEAEWEYACRAGTKTKYFFGDDPKDLGDYAWFEGNSAEKTHEHGTKKANPWGLYDMYGNVWEWCLNAYTPDYTTDGGVATRNTKAVLRGGSFVDPAENIRSSKRQQPQPKWNERNPQRPVGPWWFTDGFMVGFRLCRPVKDEPRPPLPKKPED
jgi:sulfatase modifying factor 1